MVPAGKRRVGRGVHRRVSVVVFVIVTDGVDGVAPNLAERDHQLRQAARLNQARREQP